MSKFSAIKINIKDKNNKPTSTTINFNICKHYIDRLGMVIDVDTNLNRKEMQKLIQNFVNEYQKVGLRLSKDQIEQRLLHESTIATVRNYQIMMSKI